MGSSKKGFGRVIGCGACFGFLLLATTAVAGQPTSQQPPPLSDTMTPVGAGFGDAPPPVPPSSVDNTEFEQSLTNALPLTPDQIRRAKRVRASVERALVTPALGVPEPIIRNVDLKLAAGSTPPVLHLQDGDVSTLVFEDKTGAAWPVTRVYAGQDSGISWDIVGDHTKVEGGVNGKSVEEVSTSTASNMVTLLPNTSELVGRNVAVTLQGFNVPIVFSVTAGTGQVDYRDDVQVPAYGPNADIPPPVRDMPSLHLANVQAFLDGVPPAGTKTLEASDPSVTAWFFKDKMYVRTRLTLATPSFYQRGSVTGDRLYVLAPTPMIDVFHDGALESVTISKLPPGYEYASATPASEDGQ